MEQSLQFSSHRWWILANTALGTFMATLDASIANVALPTIAGDLHVSLNAVQWVVVAYLLTISALLPVIGNLSDQWGKGKIYTSGMLVFAVGSGFCSLSQGIEGLVVSRILQAMGAALMMANSQGIVTQSFPGKERGRALGIIGTVVSLGTLTGPTVGGVLIGAFGWPSIFWVNIPIGVVGFIVALRILPQRKEKVARRPFDFFGSLLFMGGMVLLLYTVSHAETWGWGTWMTRLLLAAAFVLLLGFYWRERFTPHPLMDLNLYRNRVFAFGTMAGLLSFVSLFCITVMMPFYLQNVLHLPPEQVGLTVAASPLMMAVVAPLSGYLSDKFGPLILTTAGQTINALGFISLNLLGVHVTGWVVVLHMAIFGVGQGMFQSPNNSSIMGSVPRDKLGIAGSLNALVRNVGMVLGVSLSVTLFTYRLHVLTGQLSSSSLGSATSALAFVNALHTVFWAAAAVSILAVFFSILARLSPHQA